VPALRHRSGWLHPYTSASTTAGLCGVASAIVSASASSAVAAAVTAATSPQPRRRRLKPLPSPQPHRRQLRRRSHLNLLSTSTIVDIDAATTRRRCAATTPRRRHMPPLPQLPLPATATAHVSPWSNSPTHQPTNQPKHINQPTNQPTKTYKPQNNPTTQPTRKQGKTKAARLFGRLNMYCTCTALINGQKKRLVCVPSANSLKRRCRLDKRTDPHPKGVGDSSRPVGSARQVGDSGTQVAPRLRTLRGGAHAHTCPWVLDIVARGRVVTCRGFGSLCMWNKKFMNKLIVSRRDSTTF
jgi:hypothetical protein